MKSTATDLDWYIKDLKSSYAICSQGHDWQKCGLRITILRNSNGVAFNSIVEPSESPIPFTGGSNNKNYENFKKKLLDLNRGIDIHTRSERGFKQMELSYLKENEWSFKNKLERTFFYTLSFAFLISGLVMMFKGHAIGALLIMFSFPYFILDFKALKEKVQLLKKLRKTDPNNRD